MVNASHFIAETSSKRKRKIVLTTFVICLILIGMGIAGFTVLKESIKNTSLFKPIYNVIVNEIQESTPVGLFYQSFLTGLFFVPFPQELFFYIGLQKGNSIILSVLLSNAGYLLAQALNYALGWSLSQTVIHLISKKTLYKARRYVNKHGRTGLFLFNLFPLPAPVLTLGLGITKYNIYRLFFYTLLGSMLKYPIVVLFFLVTK